MLRKQVKGAFWQSFTGHEMRDEERRAAREDSDVLSEGEQESVMQRGIPRRPHGE